jgi:hypothetical protein
VNWENVPNKGYYFNVVNIQDDGHMMDNPDFSGFKLELRRYSEAFPENRIYPPPDTGTIPAPRPPHPEP